MHISKTSVLEKNAQCLWPSSNVRVCQRPSLPSWPQFEADQKRFPGVSHQPCCLSRFPMLCYFPMRAQQPCGWSARCIPSLAHPPHHSCPNLSCHPLRWPQCATVPLAPTTPDSHAVWNHIITSIWPPWRYKKHWALCSFDKECLTCDMLWKPVRSNKYCSDALSNARVNEGRGQNMFL